MRSIVIPRQTGDCLVCSKERFVMKLISRIFLFVFAGTVIFALVGCSDDGITDIIEEVQGDTPATLEKRIGRANEFAVKLYQEIRSSDDNLIISPHSIITVFGMAYAGARGNTEKQIADVLCFNYPQGGFHSVLKQLNDLLVNHQEVTLMISNGCWASDNYTFIPAYFDTLSVNYDADVEYLDFAGHPDESRDTINQWVSDHSKGVINNILNPGDIDALTCFVLANTVYFSANWLHAFDTNSTHSGSFKRLDGYEVVVPIMYGEECMPYCESNGYRAMEIPYEGNKVSMVLILPDEGQYEAFEVALSPTIIDSVIGNLEMTHVTFNIPKFSFFSSYDLISALQNMGMTDAFAQGADFSGMDGTNDGIPWINLVAHKAYIAIDEFGTLAVGGTVMAFTTGSYPHFGAVRPFIFVIRDIESGTILFIGRVLDPSVE
jgi:serpin B